MAAVANTRRIRGDGETTEAGWRDWLGALHVQGSTLDQLLGAAQRLVIVSPHPDDEVLACGGLAALHAARGGSVAVVAVTDGEASHRGDPAWPAARLTDARRVERQRGLAALGLAPDCVTRLALPDSDVTSQRLALARCLRNELRHTDCVVSTWRLDGHPDHDATGAVSAEACADVGCRLLEAPVWMWHWAAAADARVPWPRLRALELPRAILVRKAAALASHTTQLTPRGGEAPVLGPAILARAARRAEYFFV